VDSNSFDLHRESGDVAADRSFQSHWWTSRLTGPLIAAAVVRFALLAVALARKGVGSLTTLDTISYLEPGRNLLLHGRFVIDGVPDLFRTPGYPLFLAITSLPGLPAAAVANVILSVFSVLLVWRLARAAFRDDRTALGAAWIFAFEPLTILLSVSLMSEPLFLVFVLLSLERVAEFLHQTRLPVLAAGGVWLAAATFVRPVTYYLPVLLAAGLFLVLLQKPGLRWKAPAVLLISTLPWLAAWQARNWIETGYRGFCSVTETNLYFWNAGSVLAHIEHKELGLVRLELGDPGSIKLNGQGYLTTAYLNAHPEQAGWSQGQRLAFMHSEAMRVIRAHPGIHFGECLAAFLVTIFDTDERSFNALVDPGAPRYVPRGLRDLNLLHQAITFARAYPWAAIEKAVFVIVMLALYLLAVWGVFCGRLEKPCLWLLLGTSTYFFAVAGAAGGTWTDGRYRLPAMPQICILASAGLLRNKTLGDNKVRALN
jgi:hypothetical protein